MVPCTTLVRRASTGSTARPPRTCCQLWRLAAPLRHQPPRRRPRRRRAPPPRAQDSASVPVSDLARLVKDEQIASIDVSGDRAVATTRQHQTFGVHIDQRGDLPQLLETFGVSSDQLGQVSYRVSNPPPFGQWLT